MAKKKKKTQASILSLARKFVKNCVQWELTSKTNLLDLDFNQEDDFYDWVNSHLLIHEQIARALGVQ